MISKAERDIIEWIETHLFEVALIGVLVLGSLICITLKDVVSEDARNFLLPWYMIAWKTEYSALKNRWEIIISFTSFMGSM